MDWPSTPSPWECRCGAVWVLEEPCDPEEAFTLAAPEPERLPRIDASSFLPQLPTEDSPTATASSQVSSRLLSAAASAQALYEAERKQGLQRPPVKCTWFPSRRTAPEALGPHVHVRSASSQRRARPRRASGAARRVGFTPANATAIRHPPPTATLCILGLACSSLPPWPPLSPASPLPHPHRSPSAGVSPWRSAKFGVATNTQLHELGSQAKAVLGRVLCCDMAPCRTVWTLLCTGFLASQPATPVPCGHDIQRGAPAPAGARAVAGYDPGESG